MPEAGAEFHTGDVVARYAERLWLDAPRQPLLISFEPEAVAGMQVSLPSATSRCSDLHRHIHYHVHYHVHYQLCFIPLAPLTGTLLLDKQAGAPAVHRGLKMLTFFEGWYSLTKRLECCALVAQESLWTAKSIAMPRKAGFACLAFLVNKGADLERLLNLGIDGILTDEVIAHIFLTHDMQSSLF